MKALTSLRDPSVQSGLLLTVKVVLAAVVAWVLAEQVLGLPLSFLAPWSALLAVHATVYRSLANGAQQVAGAVAGVLLAVVAAELIGLTPYSLGVALLVSLLIGRLSWVRGDGMTMATTVLFVMTTGFDQQEVMLLWRFVPIVLGVAVGVVVNLLVVPPLNDRSAAQYVDRIDRRLGDLLCDMAASLRKGEDGEASVDWIEETRALDHELDRAWEVVGFARESNRMNPRSRRASLVRGELTYEEILFRLEDGIAEARTMARNLRESALDHDGWPGEFATRWLDLVTEVGSRVRSRDSRVEPLLGEVEGLITHLSHEELPSERWPLFGALLSSLYNIVRVVDDVASSRLARDPAASEPR